MATYATTLTLSPSNSTSPFSFHRRGSIRRGTISSISKDIRVNDVVEIIKQQKLIQQKERINIEQQQLLKRRHSMANLRPKQKTSSSDLKQEDTLLNHINKCEACNCTTTYKDDSSTGSYSSYNNNTTSSNSLISTTTSSSELARLEQLSNDFSNFLKELREDQHNMDKIKQGQSILSQQQTLLTQLSPKSSSSSPSFFNLFKKQTPDTLQGTCTTIEAAYIPIQLLMQIPQHTKLYQLEYSLTLSHLDKTTKFVPIPQESWQKDQDVDVCQEKNCQLTFTWFQRKHHCRKCGGIYCHTHSGNQLPLFINNQPVFSRVCDACCFNLIAESLVTAG